MAQKVMGQKAAQKGSVKPREVTFPAEESVAVEVVTNVPHSERQEYPEVNAAIDRGLADVAAGRVHTRRSYAEYADVETES